MEEWTSGRGQSRVGYGSGGSCLRHLVVVPYLNLRDVPDVQKIKHKGVLSMGQRGDPSVMCGNPTRRSKAAASLMLQKVRKGDRCRCRTCCPRSKLFLAVSRTWEPLFPNAPYITMSTTASVPAPLMRGTKQ